MAISHILTKVAEAQGLTVPELVVKAMKEHRTQFASAVALGVSTMTINHHLKTARKQGLFSYDTPDTETGLSQSSTASGATVPDSD